MLHEIQTNIDVKTILMQEVSRYRKRHPSEQQYIEIGISPTKDFNIYNLIIEGICVGSFICWEHYCANNNI